MIFNPKTYLTIHFCIQPFDPISDTPLKKILNFLQTFIIELKVKVIPGYWVYSNFLDILKYIFFESFNTFEFGQLDELLVRWFDVLWLLCCLIQMMADYSVYKVKTYSK